MQKSKFCGFMTNAAFSLQDHCWMENQASCLFSKSHVWKPSAWKNLSWFGLKPDFEISAFMKQKCLSSSSPSSRVKIWAPLHFMQSFSFFQFFIPPQFRDKKILSFFQLCHFLMILTSLLILCCSEGISIGLNSHYRSFTYVAELGENFEGNFAAFMQKACDFSIAHKAIFLPQCWLIILF